MIGIRRDAAPDLNDIFAKAVPAYPQAVELSSPTNSSPYRMTAKDLSDAFKDDRWRIRLLANVDSVLDGLAEWGVSVPGFLIGGGFVRRIKDGSRPRDIDGVALYKATSPSSEIVTGLARA